MHSVQSSQLTTQKLSRVLSSVTLSLRQQTRYVTPANKKHSESKTIVWNATDAFIHMSRGLLCSGRRLVFVNGLCPCLCPCPCVQVGHSALHLAAMENSLGCLDVLLKHPACDVNVYNKQGRTALQLSAFRGHHLVVERLLSVDGIQVNQRSQVSFYSAFLFFTVLCSQRMCATTLALLCV